VVCTKEVKLMDEDQYDPLEDEDLYLGDEEEEFA